MSLHNVAMRGYETISERARREKVHHTTVWRWIKADRIDAVRPLGDLGPWLIPIRDDGGADGSRADDVRPHNRPEGGQRAAPA